MIITNTQNNSFTQPISTSSGTSVDWNSNYTSFNTQSAANASVYTAFNTQSAANASVYTAFNTQSAANDSVYNNVSTLSSNMSFNLYARNVPMATVGAYTVPLTIPANINELTGGVACVVTDVAILVKTRTLNPSTLPTTGNLFVTPPSFALENTAGNSHANSLSIGVKPLVGNYSRTSNGVGSTNASGKYTYNGAAARIVNTTSTTLAFVTTTLAAGVDAAVTSLPVNANAAFSSTDFHIKLDNEIMYVSAGGSGATMTVARGQLGTTAAAHSLGATVTTNVGPTMLLVDACYTMRRFDT